jgi:hypothetical protein
VFEMVTNGGLGRYDVAFDSWAAHEPGIAARVKEVYRYRYDYVKSLFREMGYRGIELETRVTAYFGFLRSDSWMAGYGMPKRSSRRVAKEFEFFVRD